MKDLQLKLLVPDNKQVIAIQLDIWMKHLELLPPDVKTMVPSIEVDRTMLKAQKSFPY